MSAPPSLPTSQKVLARRTAQRRAGLASAPDPAELVLAWARHGEALPPRRWAAVHRVHAVEGTAGNAGEPEDAAAEEDAGDEAWYTTLVRDAERQKTG